MCQITSNEFIPVITKLNMDISGHTISFATEHNITEGSEKEDDKTKQYCGYCNNHIEGIKNRIKEISRENNVKIKVQTSQLNWVNKLFESNHYCFIKEHKDPHDNQDVDNDLNNANDFFIKNYVTHIKYYTVLSNPVIFLVSSIALIFFNTIPAIIAISVIDFTVSLIAKLCINYLVLRKTIRDTSTEELKSTVYVLNQVLEKTHKRTNWLAKTFFSVMDTLGLIMSGEFSEKHIKSILEKELNNREKQETRNFDTSHNLGILPSSNYL